MDKSAKPVRKMATRVPTQTKNGVPIREFAAETLKHWNEDNVPRLAAAFSFYAVLSLAPLVVLAVVAAGYFFEKSAIRTTILQEVDQAVGGQARDLILSIIDKTYKPGASTVATVFSLLVTFFGASGLFLQLNEAVNSIWQVPPPEGQPFWKSLILQRIPAFLGVLVFGLVIIAWLALDSWLAWLHKQTSGFQGWQAVSILVSTLFLALVLAFAYKNIPEGKVQWRDVWLGAFVAAVGISIAKFALSLYFTYAAVAGGYGPAGGLVLILLWIYYASQIFFLGVEIVHVYSHASGSRKGLAEKPAQNYS